MRSSKRLFAIIPALVIAVMATAAPAMASVPSDSVVQTQVADFTVETGANTPAASAGAERAPIVYGCAITPKHNVTVVNVRRTTNTSYASIGQVRAGQRIPAVCSRLQDGWYDICGSNGSDPLRDNWWVEVQWPGYAHAYVASLCVNWA